MADGPLERPAHLVPAAAEPWHRARKAGALALGLGALSFVIAAVVHGELSSMPDLWLTVPGFAATAIASAASVARREPRAVFLWALGLGLAGAAIVLGWFLMLSIVVAATAIVILILHAVM
ncbi:MAG TPA: hypothetical protein VNO30_31155 [Kofleriaceae bacterium]|nr:hypothetical protein [Kofleriaceae bacterium]